MPQAFKRELFHVTPLMYTSYIFVLLVRWIWKLSLFRKYWNILIRCNIILGLWLYYLSLYLPIHFVPAEPLFRHSMTFFKIMRWFWHTSFTIKGIFSLRTLIYPFQPFQHIVISLIISGYYGFSSKNNHFGMKIAMLNMIRYSEKLLKFYRFLF